MGKNRDLVEVTEIEYNVCEGTTHFEWREATDEEVQNLRSRYADADKRIRRFKKNRIIVKKGQEFRIEEDNCHSTIFRVEKRNGEPVLRLTTCFDKEIILTKEEAKDLSSKIRIIKKEIELEEDLYPGSCPTNICIESMANMSIYEIEKLTARLEHLRKRTTFVF